MPETSLFDGLIKGTVETIYRFVGLTAAALLFPFVKRSVRFWPVVVSTQARFSSVSFLVVWIFAATSLGSNAAKQITSSIVLKQTNYPVLYLLIRAFFLAIVVDLLLRLCCSFINNQVRRHLYQPLLRLAVGAIFAGSYIASLISAHLIQGYSFDIFGYSLLYSPSLWVLALSLATITNKVLRKNNLKRSLPISIVVSLIVPPALINFIFFSDAYTNAIISRVLPTPSVEILSQNTTCQKVGDDQFSVRAYLTLRNMSSTTVRGDNFDVYSYSSAASAKKPLGTGSADDVFVLTDSTYAPVQLIFKAAADAVKPEEASFPCGLVLTYLPVGVTVFDLQ